MELAKIGNLYYPELMGGLCIVRGPPAAAWSVRVAKRFDVDNSGTLDAREQHDGRHVLRMGGA